MLKGVKAFPFFEKINWGNIFIYITYHATIHSIN